jgi:hypothetical protein
VEQLLQFAKDYGFPGFLAVVAAWVFLQTFQIGANVWLQDRNHRRKFDLKRLEAERKANNKVASDKLRKGTRRPDDE